MPIDDRTSRLNLPLPNQDNFLEDDVQRLRDALSELDSKVATVDETGKVPVEQLPDTAVTETFEVSNEASMLALAAQPGDFAIRNDLRLTFILKAEPASDINNWQELLNDALDQLGKPDGYQKVGGLDKNYGNIKNTREAWRRSLAESGLTLAAGSFEEGATASRDTDAVWHIASGQCYTWDGAFNKTVPSGSTPASTGGVGPGNWMSVQDAALRSQLASTTGFDLLGGRKKLVILATGQSNAQQEPAYAWTPPPNVFVWEWPGLGGIGKRFIPCPTDKINHTYGSAAELARLNPGWQVYVVRIASGGRPIDHWLPGGSNATSPTWNAYADCKNNIEAALALLGLDRIDLFHWHQGESDISNVGAYKPKWDLLHDRFCGETWFKKNTRILVNGITSAAIKGDPAYSSMNLTLKSIVRDSPSIRTLVPTSEIVPADLWLSDGLHMSGEGHYFLGIAEAQALQFGGALPLPQGYAYNPETRSIGLGGAAPAAGGTVEVNRGTQPNGLSYNARTSLDVINTQTDSGDLVSLRVIGANGAFSVTSYGVGALTNSVRMEWTGSSQMQMAVTAGGAFTQYAGSTEILRCASGVLRPGTTDNVMSLGIPSNRFSQVCAAAGSINTSDGREKCLPLPIDDAVLDAWQDVQIIGYQWLEAIRTKGEDAARWHFGVIAQQVRDAFLARGIDGTRYGLLCYDEWEARGAIYRHLTDEELASGKYPSPQTMVLVEPEIEAGNRWGIRPDECLFLEAALQRRNYERLLSQHSEFSARIEALEAKLK